jgi:zinc transport system substrate-binding protein
LLIGSTIIQIEIFPWKYWILFDSIIQPIGEHGSPNHPANIPSGLSFREQSHMSLKAHSLVTAALLLSLFSVSCHKKDAESNRADARKSIVASDTILSGMSESLLPSAHFDVVSILPPGQCPGHYDVKLTDIAKVKRADLVVSFIGMPFMQQAEVDAGKQLLIDARDRNWMAPDSYIAGLNLLAERFSARFPEYRQLIGARMETASLEVEEKNKNLSDRIKRSGVSQKTVIASSMLKEPLEWMGFRVIGEYGRPESISAKEIADLIRVGRKQKAVMIVDNLQSGPEAGRGIAEALGVPHVALSNFPSEKGYAATLSDNVDAVLAALSAK